MEITSAEITPETVKQELDAYHAACLELENAKRRYLVDLEERVRVIVSHHTEAINAWFLDAANTLKQRRSKIREVCKELVEVTEMEAEVNKLG